MRKFTFITLMMILGMSSVSFGKSYLCIPKKGTLLTPKVNILVTNQSDLNRKKFLVKTEGNNRKMISVKFFGKYRYLCKVGEKLFEKGFGVISGVGESIKGGNFLTCRQPHTILEGGFTKVEFILNLKKRKFHFYNLLEFRMGQTYSGKCEEI